MGQSKKKFMVTANCWVLIPCKQGYTLITRQAACIEGKVFKTRTGAENFRDRMLERHYGLPELIVEEASY